jgi:UDP-glucose 4-epimerase
VYGSSDSGAIPEGASAQPQSPYAVHKLVAERLCWSYGRFFGVSSVVIRFFSIYGPGLRKQLFWDACTRLARGEGSFAGTGDEIRDWLHVEDAAALVLASIDRAVPEGVVVNGGCGIGATVREVVTALRDDLGNHAKVSFTGERRPGDPTRFIANNALARSWGWTPKLPWRDGAREFAAWFSTGAP